MIKLTETFQPIYPDLPFRPGDAVLDLSASSRYWRTSRIEQLVLITRDAQDAASVLKLQTASDEDEFTLLEELSGALLGIRRIITFNGHSFDLPHLRQKYRAYRMADPLSGKEELDLYRELRDLVSFFGIPSGKLTDAAAFLKLPYPNSYTDAEAALELMSLLRYKEFLQSEDPEILELSFDDERIVYRISAPYRFPISVSVHDACFHIRFLEEGIVLLSARILDGCLRYYHTDFSQYEYLPVEGYAIHRSAAHFVDRSRREKATRSTCFHLVKFTEELVRDEGKAKAYLRSVLRYLGTR